VQRGKRQRGDGDDEGDAESGDHEMAAPLKARRTRRTAKDTKDEGLIICRVHRAGRGCGLC
jgi:hypothetical protein